jgi:hypothetical protein
VSPQPRADTQVRPDKKIAVCWRFGIMLEGRDLSRPSGRNALPHYESINQSYLYERILMVGFIIKVTRENQVSPPFPKGGQGGFL